jgi:hypothetical protein
VLVPFGGLSTLDRWSRSVKLMLHPLHVDGAVEAASVRCFRAKPSYCALPESRGRNTPQHKTIRRLVKTYGRSVKSRRRAATKSILKIGSRELKTENSHAKDAKAQRKASRNAAALRAFAPLREKFFRPPNLSCRPSWTALRRTSDNAPRGRQV